MPVARLDAAVRLRIAMAAERVARVLLWASLDRIRDRLVVYESLRQQ